MLGKHRHFRTHLMPVLVRNGDFKSLAKRCHDQKFVDGLQPKHRVACYQTQLVHHSHSEALNFARRAALMQTRSASFEVTHIFIPKEFQPLAAMPFNEAKVSVA